MIAGYHWFTDWGRDTMISLEGLTLTTGRAAEAGYILRTFAHYIRDGLIPNLFPEGQTDGLYHTADASLWFFHAVDRYLEWTQDRESLLAVFPRLLEIAERHIAGTRFGIGVDPSDGLLRQGARGTSLPGWTPRWAIGWSRRDGARPWRSTPCGTTRCGSWRAGCASVAARMTRTPTGTPAHAEMARSIVQRPVLVRLRRLPLRRGGR